MNRLYKVETFDFPESQDSNILADFYEERLEVKFERTTIIYGANDKLIEHAGNKLIIAIGFLGRLELSLWGSNIYMVVKPFSGGAYEQTLLYQAKAELKISVLGNCIGFLFDYVRPVEINNKDVKTRRGKIHLVAQEHAPKTRNKSYQGSSKKVHVKKGKNPRGFICSDFRIANT